MRHENGVHLRCCSKIGNSQLYRTPKILIMVVPHGRNAFLGDGINGKTPKAGTDKRWKLPRDGTIPLDEGTIPHASVNSGKHETWTDLSECKRHDDYEVFSVTMMRNLFF